MTRNNALSVFLMGALPAVGGSAISFFLIIFLAWGLICLVAGRFKVELTPSDRYLATAFTLFAAVIVGTGLLADNRDALFQATYWLIPFLSVWVVVPRLRTTPQLDYLSIYLAGSIVGALGALASSIYYIVVTIGGRPEGGAGNAVVFAAMCLCLTGLSALAIDQPRRSMRVLAGMAFFAGILAVILSLTRGAWLAIVPVVALAVLYNPRRWAALARRPAGFLVMILAAIVAFIMRDTIEIRTSDTIAELRVLFGTGYSPSIGERARLWEAAWSAFEQAPLLGYGIQNRMQALVPFLQGDGLAITSYSHPHNGYLAFALDGGIVALVALIFVILSPVVIAYRAPRSSEWRKRLFAALIVTTVYSINGVTQIMLKHDIMDSYFIFFSIVIAASIVAPAPSSASAGQQVPDAPGRPFKDLVASYVFALLACVIAFIGIARSFDPYRRIDTYLYQAAAYLPFQDVLK